MTFGWCVLSTSRALGESGGLNEATSDIFAAAKIWYRAHTCMTSSTNYAGARTPTLQAAADLSPDLRHSAMLGTSNLTVTVKDSTNATGTTPFTWNVVSVIIVFENTTDVAIPDKGAAVFSDINVTGLSGNAPSALQVDVDIRHTFRGDLVIDLQAPDGTLYRLKDSDIHDSADNVIATYTVNASSEVANGTWKLKVQDMFSSDTGRINSWKLTFWSTAVTRLRTGDTSDTH
ncbi:proprotein convertase P-domain-containing protein [Streptomyces sp. NPDC007863]|uniref:proprotein convertase P-domain-containing protein n=1 Tax=Streptomyces sp. NPDC007863 TaxID=3154894 RepID=UPI0033D5C144